MATIILFLLLFILLFLRVPIAISLGTSSIVALWLIGFSTDTIILKMFTTIGSPILMAIPGFIFAGLIMAHGGIAKYLIEAMTAWLGHTRGGLSVIAILTCLVFAAISGSSAATAVAVGSIMIPAMVSAGYEKRYSMGLIAAAGTLGILMPPSIPLIIYGSIAEISIRNLFTAAIVPALILGSALVLFAIIVAKRKEYGGLEKIPMSERWKPTRKALWGIMFPFLILGSIYGGFVTPTEASFLSVLYAFLVSVFIYREMSWSMFKKVVIDSVNTTSMIFLIVASASLFGMFLTLEQIPQGFAQWVVDNNFSTLTFLLVVSGLLFILGMFLDATAMLLITLPIFLPVLILLDINLYYFAVIMVINMEIGLITPPLGINLFVVSGISKEKIESVIKGVIPFYIVFIIVLLIIIMFPKISLFLL